MKHLVIGQHQRLLISRLSIGHHTAVWFPLSAICNHESSTFTEKDETSLITESDQSGPNHQQLQLCTACTAWSDRTRLRGPCIAAIAGYFRCPNIKNCKEVKPANNCDLFSNWNWQTGKVCMS